MGKSLYVTDPAVAANYHVDQGSWVYVANDAEAAWLLTNHHAYGLNHPGALPAAGYVNPFAPSPFTPYAAPPAPSPPAPTPAPAPPPPRVVRTLQIGSEDQYIKIDQDGDGTTDVHVVIDNPPKNTP